MGSLENQIPSIIIPSIQFSLAMTPLSPPCLELPQVENIALLSNAKDNGFIGVNM